MNNSSLFSILRLIRSEGLGPLTFYTLINHFGSAETTLENWTEIPTLSKRKITLASPEIIQREIEEHLKEGANLLSYTDPSYPSLLKELPDAPPVLSLKGNLELLTQNMVGIVGARNASSHGCRLAYLIAKELGEYGWKTISGLARGIDTAAHKGSLSNGTIAVLAGGINIVYPEENKKLYEEISEKGLLVSEVSLGTPPQSAFFPRRNRLISGLSKGVAVVEAALQSGSLITAKFATDQGRDVFAVPGSPLDPRCRGTNKLLKQGATLVENAADILNILETSFSLKPLTQKVMEKSPSPSSFPLKNEEEILEYLSAVPLPIDQLLQQINLSTTVLMPALLNLEIQGKIERHPGGQISKVLQG